MARRCSAPCDEMHLPRLLHQGETGRTGSKSLVPLSARSISKSSVDSSTSSPLGGGSWQLGGASRNLRRVSLQRGLVHETPPSKSDELPSFEELSRDLQGWNGRWKQKKASVLMEERLRVDEMEILQKRYEMEERRRKDEEKREHRRRTIELEQHELQEEVARHEARQKAKRLASAWSRMASRALELQELLIEKLLEPSDCGACHGSGECLKCRGEGLLTVTYLTPSVQTRKDEVFRGRCVYGCNACGGVRDGNDIFGQQSAQPGTGVCRICHGQGQIWPSMRDVMAQVQAREVSWSDVLPPGEINVYAAE